ncbi:MAG: DUF2232 domain-containing protein [Mariprofundaceae bacterium]|nr:DUF2232 domain-containing protein [Mariprofundaceae bacterium]
MNQQPPEPEHAQQVAAMPPVMDFFLTKRFPCAFLIVFMLTSSILFEVTLGSVPLLGLIAALLGTLLLTAVPAVFALALLGGGLKYTLQVAAIATLAIMFLSSASGLILLIFVGFFVVPTLLVTQRLQLPQQFQQASWLLLSSLFALVFITLWFSSDASSIKATVTLICEPLFANMLKNVPVGDAAALLQVQQLQSNIIFVFPGMLVFSLWLVWWWNILFARQTAHKYGFFHGDDTPMLHFAMPSHTVYVLLAAALFANIADGGLQYISINVLLVLASMYAVQGVAVVHLWLRSKGMSNSVVIMYVMLFFWVPIIPLFMIIGLLDIWFNFRRNMLSTTGET